MTPATDPYEALAAIVERELALVADRDFDGLAEVTRERAALVGTLPATPPAAANATLRRCLALQQRVGIELARVREAILIELAQVRLGQRAAAGYAPARRRVPRVDANA
jgi:hypothetical protein